MGSILVTCIVSNYLSYTGQRMDWAIYLGAFQGFIAHVMYWLRSSSTTKHSWDLCNDIQYDDWRYILRVVHCLFHQCHTDYGLSWSQLQGKGATSLFSYGLNVLSKCADPLSVRFFFICNLLRQVYNRHFHSMFPAWCPTSVKDPLIMSLLRDASNAPSDVGCSFMFHDK